MPTEEAIVVKQSLSVPPSPANNSKAVEDTVLTVGQALFPAEIPEHEHTPELTHKEDNKGSQKGPTTSADNPFMVPAADSSQLSKPTMLHEAIQHTYREVALRRACRNSLVWLLAPMRWTGSPYVVRALNDLRGSRHMLWLGDTHTILHECEWASGLRSSTATLQWRNNATHKLADHGNDAIIAFVGAVSTEGLTMGGDGGWLPATGTVQGGDEDEDSQSGCSKQPKEGLPEGYGFKTWNLSSETRAAFNHVIEQGHQPQLPEAYTRSNTLIHPNNANATLASAMVLVQCTLERMCFPTAKDRRPRTEFQFYANLVRVQVLKRAPLVRFVAAIKCKHVHTYGPGDDFESDDNSGPTKKLKLTLPTY
ncbi:hypothetical protein FRC12_023117 [Ceratobasidium sp. 428]|nr:hypothetical protein FRC12_023117 [Ceratobasidium sp. 428]